MDKIHFLRQMEEMLDLPPESLTGEEHLSSLPGWDSLAALGVVSMAEQTTDLVLRLDQFKDLQTVDDVYCLVSSRS